MNKDPKDVKEKTAKTTFTYSKEAILDSIKQAKKSRAFSIGEPKGKKKPATSIINAVYERFKDIIDYETDVKELDLLMVENFFEYVEEGVFK